MQIDYNTIKQKMKAEKRGYKEFPALAPANDPFYAGTKGDWEKAQWFAKLWQQFGYGSGVHLRRVHYQIISQDPPVCKPDGYNLPEH